jgi:hypothetical protein
LEAFKGFILAAGWAVVFLMWVAKLQVPSFHFWAGLGKERQYFPLSNSLTRSQPSQDSMIGLQAPPLKVHPFGVIKVQGTPGLILAQFMAITPFH